MTTDRLSAYEEHALLELAAWKDPPRTVLGRAADRVELGVAKLMERVPLQVLERILAWLLPRFREMTWRATSQPRVLRRYQQAGASVARLADVAELDLELADRAAGDKRLHEGAVAGLEGAAAGFFGGFALAADVAGVTLLSIRAVQSRGLAYGFDPSADEELSFVLHVLDAAARLGPASKTAARSAVSLVSLQTGNRAVMRVVEETMQRVPKQLVARLATLKAESVAPIVGALSSASFNAWYLQAVTSTARMAYRERFLRRKYGADLLAAYGL